MSLVHRSAFSVQRFFEASAADEAHRAGGLLEVGLVDVVARLLLVDERADVVGELFARRAGAEDFAQGVFGLGEEAGSYLAVGREAHARARAAEGLGDGRDDAYLAGRAVREAVARRRLAPAPAALSYEQEALVYG